MNQNIVAQRRSNWPHFSVFSIAWLSLALCISAGAQGLTDPAKSGAGKDTKSPSVVKPAPVPPAVESYTVGSGDVLHIDVWQEQEVSQVTVVRPDGNISLPLINEVKVSGLTPLQIQELIGQKLKSFVNDPKVTVTVSEIHSKRAFITGEVTRPGEYSLNTQITVLQLIAQAGGFTPFAKTEHVVVLRMVNGAEQRLKFRYKEVVHGKNVEQNITLQPGDTVVVP
ncbi:MAG TPA: polysaccharide biosynthesis/export family protein [Terriglobia bacterium]|nr:polysaccharide biosynthesis/export family protein [Terriglobia bacterium]